MLAPSLGFYYGNPASHSKAAPMPTARTAPTNMDRFIRDTGRRAQVMAEIALRDKEAALDIVQDSFLALISRYADKPATEWAPLFYTILQSRLMDWKRKEARRGKWFSWLTPNDDDDNPLEDIPTATDEDPATLLSRADDMQTVQLTLSTLPLRQQQAFLLRAWEGLDTITTAQIMACSESSVKTHYARAIAAIRIALIAANHSQEATT
jgi:RNA polymerase sigma-70 factor (ECF subfamily)